MGNAAELNGIGTEHNEYPQTLIISAPTVTIDSKPAVRVGDPFEQHDKPN